MKFKEITLVDFMRYKGENTIRFSTDDKKMSQRFLEIIRLEKQPLRRLFGGGFTGK